MEEEGCCNDCVENTESIFKIIIGTIIGVALIPITIPLIILLWIWRLLVVGVIWTLKGGEVTTASGMEAMWGLDDPGARAIITSTVVLKGKINISQIRGLLEENILDVIGPHGALKYPHFRQHLRQLVGVSVWLPDRQFCIRRHVRSLPEVADETELISTAGKLANTPLPSENPQWEVLLVPISNYASTPTISMTYPRAVSTPASRRTNISNVSKPEASHTALLLRLHHALGDGRSLVQLMLSALVDPKTCETPHIDPVLESSSKWLHYLHILWALTQLPWVAWRLLVRHDRSHLHGSKLNGTKRLAWAPPISLLDFKYIKAHTKASVNDIMLTCIASAIHRQLMRIGGTVPKTTTTVVPVDVWGPNNPDVPANKNSLCTLRLPTGDMSLLMRLRKVRSRMMKLKRSPDVLVIHSMMDKLLNIVPAPIARWGLSTKGVTLVASNMKGPTDDIHIMRLPVDDLMFWIPNKSWTGIGISIISYRGWIRVGIAVDSALISDQTATQIFVDDITYQFQQLLSQIEEIKSTYEKTPESRRIPKKVRKCICQKCRKDSLRDHININNLEKGYSEESSLIDIVIQCEHEYNYHGEVNGARKPENCSKWTNNNFRYIENKISGIFREEDDDDDDDNAEQCLVSNPLNLMEENPDGFLFIDEE